MGALVFLSYAPEDSAHRDVLEKHLAPLVRARVLRLWHDGKAIPGEDRDDIAATQLEEAELVLLLVSADYLASEDCHSEMTRALERAERGLVRVVPILLRPCLANRNALGGLAALPTDGRPVTTWTSADDAWSNVAKGIARALDADALGTVAPAGVEGATLSAGAGATSRSRTTLRTRKPLDDDTILCLARLEDARVRRRRLEEAGAGTRDVDAQILALKRQLREGGQVRQGDLIGGRYSLLQPIGRGGFATVWEAEDRRDRKRVALKVLHTNLADDPDRTDRFLRGARVMADLTHPAVVRIYNAHVEDGGYCCVAMELVPGGDLQRAVVEGRMPRERVIPLILRVGDALVEAHARGYVHRDIKPANILLDAEGSPKLTDFDLVGDEDTSGGTRTGAMGTFVYAAPEILSRPQDATVRADVFGLSMTALFCLHGRKLPDTAFRNPERVIAQIGDKQVGDVLRKAVEWDPADRFPTMKDFCDALRAAHLASPLSVRSSAAGERSGAGSNGGEAPGPRPDRMRRTTLTVFASVLALGGVVAARQVGCLRGATVQGSPLVCPEGMIAIPGDTFEMGTSEKAYDDDEPPHEVTLSPFCIDRTEVTVAAYRECTQKERNGVKCPDEMPSTVRWCGKDPTNVVWSTWCNGPSRDREDHPINCVDWKMADTYCRWAGKRLPTEAQWEYAARGTTGRTYPWGDDAPAPMWLNACGQECRELFSQAGSHGWDTLYDDPDPWPTTSPVGAVAGDRTAFGLCDMGGNVTEWVADWYAPYDPAMTTDPLQKTPDAKRQRVVRGLNWTGKGEHNARATYRWSEPDGHRCVNVGFRCASDIVPPLARGPSR